jgi:hypothetical protein
MHSNMGDATLGYKNKQMCCRGLCKQAKQQALLEPKTPLAGDTVCCGQYRYGLNFQVATSLTNSQIILHHQA